MSNPLPLLFAFEHSTLYLDEIFVQAMYVTETRTLISLYTHQISRLSRHATSICYHNNLNVTEIFSFSTFLNSLFSSSVTLLIALSVKGLRPGGF